MSTSSFYIFCLCLPAIMTKGYPPVGSVVGVEERVDRLENLFTGLSVRMSRVEQGIETLLHSSNSAFSSPSVVYPPRYPNTHLAQPHPQPSVVTPPSPSDSANEGGFKPRDCSQIKDSLSPKQRHSTFYTIYPISKHKPLEVFCDMESFGGGWTIIQRRGFQGDKREDFNRTWDEYRHGFGALNADYWLGLENIVALTQYNNQEVLYEFINIINDGLYTHGKRVLQTVRYGRFKVEDRVNLYRLQLQDKTDSDRSSPEYYLENQNGLPFTTRDRDNTGTNIKGCRPSSGWWLQGTICHRQPDLNMPFDRNGVLHLHKYNDIQDRNGVSIKIRTRTPFS